MAVGPLGLKPWEFWELTPHEFNLMVEGYADKEAKRLQELLYAAWHIEAFSRQKKLPRLETVLKTRYRRKPEKVKPDREELINIARLKGLKGPWDRA